MSLQAIASGRGRPSLTDQSALHLSRDTQYLAHYRRTSPPRSSAKHAWPDCPNRTTHEVFNPDTGEVRPARCLRLTCFACLPMVALRLSGAIRLARPNGFGLLTAVGDDWPTVRSRMNGFRRMLRRRFEVVDAFHVEPNPRGTGNHVHMWLRGDDVSASAMSEFASRAGFGAFANMTSSHQPREPRVRPQDRDRRSRRRYELVAGRAGVPEGQRGAPRAPFARILARCVG